ncbi:MAG: hypothetical protein ABFQ62_04485 [Patescibacteria group bacterium]
MKKNILKTTSFLLTTLASFIAFTKSSFAAITNPAIDPSIGADAGAAAEGSIMLNYFVSIWRTVINIGAIILLIYLLWGGIDWITSGGDSGKVANARNKMTQGVIGMIILAFSFVIVGFIGNLFFGDQFDILSLTFIEP